MRDQFEKDIKQMPVYIAGSVEREARTPATPKSVWYTNQVVNAMFIAYMHGYQAGRVNYM